LELLNLFAQFPQLLATILVVTLSFIIATAPFDNKRKSDRQDTDNYDYQSGVDISPPRCGGGPSSMRRILKRNPSPECALKASLPEARNSVR